MLSEDFDFFFKPSRFPSINISVMSGSDGKSVKDQPDFFLFFLVLDVDEG